MAINKAPKPIKGRPWILLAFLLVTILLMARLRQCAENQLPADQPQSDVSELSDDSSSHPQSGKNAEFVEFL